MIPDNADQASQGESRPRRRFSFSLLVPLGELVLCAVVLLIVCGPRGFIPSKPGSPSLALSNNVRKPPEAERQDGIQSHVFRFITVLNLPGVLLQDGLRAVSGNHPGVEMISRGYLGWLFLTVPFWWMAGRSADALLAIRQKAIAPHIHLVEGIVAVLLLAGGFLLSIAAFQTPGGGWVGTSELIWGTVGGIIVLARYKQRRISRAYDPEVVTVG